MLLSFIVTNLLIPLLHSQDYCIWGKTGANSHVNGLYINDGTWNSKPSYIKTLGDGCVRLTVYLWSTGNASWIISDTKGSDLFNMQCSQSDLSSCTTNNWGTGNEAVFAQANTCPSWDCESISTTTTYAQCDGPFDTLVGSNAWRSEDNMYWYFVPHMFSWVCYSALEITSCPTTHYVIAETGWTDLLAGSNTILNITTGMSPTFAPSTINCLGTQIPTQSPAPTQATSPNNSPTSSPVSVPPVTAGSICIWGRTDPTFLNTAINGLYHYDGEYSNNPSYKKTIDCSTGLVTAYLYYRNSQWMIGDTKGSARNYANCAETDISQCRAGKWQAVITNGGGFETEPNLYAQHNSCPSWDCAAISSTDSNSFCTSFNTQIDTNAWQGANGYIWFFDPTLFIWKCIDGDTYPNYEQCTNPYSSATMPGTWRNLSNGQQTTLTYSFPPTTTTATLTCSSVTFPSPTAATSTPTGSTTSEPTTVQPTTFEPTTSESTTSETTVSASTTVTTFDETSVGTGTTSTFEATSSFDTTSTITATESCEYNGPKWWFYQNVCEFCLCEGENNVINGVDSTVEVCISIVSKLIPEGHKKIIMRECGFEGVCDFEDVEVVGGDTVCHCCCDRFFCGNNTGKGNIFEMIGGMMFTLLIVAFY